MNRPFCSLTRYLTLALVFIAFAVAPALARAENASAGNADLFNRLDANGDGKITATEVQPENKRLFARLLRRADAEKSQELSREEFLAALVPSRPEKILEAEQPDSLPQADAVRYLLLTMDTNRNSSINIDEVPEDLLPVFDALAERVDSNKNDTLDRFELGRNAPVLGQAAMRYVSRERIDVAAELKKLKRSQGKAADRFDRQLPTLDSLNDPKKAGALFAQLDADGNGQLALDEVPEPIQRQLERFMRFSDRNQDDRLNEREFLAGVERISRLQGRRPGREMRERDAMSEREAMPAKPMPAKDD